jgi:hypothetical protein
MIEDIIADMGTTFRKGVFTEKTSFRFTVDDTVMSVVVEAESFTVERGELPGKVDCSCKTSAEMFRKIWFDGYKPGMMDFFGGAIKADAPFLLPQFLRAFGKEPK